MTKNTCRECAFYDGDTQDNMPTYYCHNPALSYNEKMEYLGRTMRFKTHDCPDHQWARLDPWNWVLETPSK